MSDAPTPVPFQTWTRPECAFTIEYEAGALENVRLAVVDAFCSLPRGGVEIGGLLLGEWTPERLRITGYTPLDCEHRFGPSFTLSEDDEGRLRELIAGSNIPGAVPVGWYHSHTRSELFLSDADLAIHARFFPEPWHVALVVKPLMMRPARAAFFFRESDGRIQAAAPYVEFSLGPPPAAAVEAVSPDVPSPPALEPPSDAASYAPGLDGVTNRTPETPVLPAEASLVHEPRFLSVAESPSHKWLTPALILCGLAAGGAGAYFTQRAWLPQVVAAVKPASAPPPSLHLTVADREGQLQISWDSAAAPVRNALNATLEIVDGAQLPRAIALDQPHLHNGFVAYERQSDRVDLKLILHEPDGTQVRDVTTFLGQPPVRRPRAEDPEVRRQRDELAAKAGKLQADLHKQQERTRKLEKDLKSMRNEIRQQQKQQQKQRLTNMLSEKQ